VFILKAVKVLYFDTLSQVFILNDLLARRFASLDLYALGGDFARGLQRTGWGANFMSYDSAKCGCCQDKYILGELLVRTDWQVVGGARVMEDKYAPNAMA